MYCARYLVLTQDLPYSRVSRRYRPRRAAIKLSAWLFINCNLRRRRLLFKTSDHPHVVISCAIWHTMSPKSLSRTHTHAYTSRVPQLTCIWISLPGASGLGNQTMFKLLILQTLLCTVVHCLNWLHWLHSVTYMSTSYRHFKNIAHNGLLELYAVRAGWVRRRMRHNPQGLSIYCLIRDWSGDVSSQSITILYRGVYPTYYNIRYGVVFKFYYNITVLKKKWNVKILFQLYIMLKVTIAYIFLDVYS